jgi:hypothetical protein
VEQESAGNLTWKINTTKHLGLFLVRLFFCCFSRKSAAKKPQTTGLAGAVDHEMRLAIFCSPT